MDLSNFRLDAEAFLGKTDKEYYLHFAGKKPDLEIDKIYKEYDYLFSFENVEKLKTLSLDSKGENQKKNKFLYRFCAEGYLSKKFQSISDKIANDEAEAKIKVGGKEYSFRYTDILISNEADKKKREEIEDKRRETTEGIFNPNFKLYWESLHDEALLQGFKSYTELFSHLKEVDFLKLEEQMDMLVEKTTDIYSYNMDKLFKEKIGISLQGSRASDFSYIKRAKEFDVFFKKDGLIPIFKDSMNQIGIDVDKQKNIIMDVEERENKSPRAFCSVVKVPSEIYLVVMPSGGQDDFQAMFHEGGHAEHFANVSPSLDFEYKYLGDNAITEGFAFCFENMTTDRNWLMYMLKMDEEAADRFTNFIGLINLFFLRRYAGKLKYELILHNDKSVSKKEHNYSDILTKNLIMQYFPENYLKDVDEGFYCTNYIRAWMFEAHVKDYILNKFGSLWFKNKKAGDFLKELYSYGQKYSPEKIINELGYKELDINLLIETTLKLLRLK